MTWPTHLNDLMSQSSPCRLNMSTNILREKNSELSCFHFVAGVTIIYFMHENILRTTQIIEATVDQRNHKKQIAIK